MLIANMVPHRKAVCKWKSTCKKTHGELQRQSKNKNTQQYILQETRRKQSSTFCFLCVYYIFFFMHTNTHVVGEFYNVNYVPQTSSDHGGTMQYFERNMHEQNAHTHSDHHAHLYDPRTQVTILYVFGGFKFLRAQNSQFDRIHVVTFLYRTSDQATA